MPKLYVTCLFCGQRLKADVLQAHACWKDDKLSK